MSADALPINPARFSEALKDLSLSSLHLKVLEIRNSIAHLDYSNEQLRPFAEGTEATLDAAGGPAQGEPDQDCIEAIKENQQVIDRMQDRIRLIRAEVEGRGSSWTEFQSKEELEAAQGLTNGETASNAAPAQNDGAPRGDTQAQGQHQAWTDGTFQTGIIRNGEVQMNGQRPQDSGGNGGRLTDEQLRRALEERLREDQDEDDGGMHL